jgi:hypothetical protein
MSASHLKLLLVPNMYTHVWNKYLSIIRILLKRAAKETQSLQLNFSDFEKIGPQKKTGFNFTLEFRQGRVDNLAGLSNPAKELAAVLVQDAQIAQLLQMGEYSFNMNSKFVLVITLMSTPSNVDVLPLLLEPAL